MTPSVSPRPRAASRSIAGEALVNAEPDQEQGEDEKVGRTKNETLKLETLRAGEEESPNQEQGDKDDRGQRRLAPAPAHCGGEQRQDEEEDDRARRAGG